MSATKSDLYQQAKRLGVAGRSRMSKAELEAAVTGGSSHVGLAWDYAAAILELRIAAGMFEQSAARARKRRVFKNKGAKVAEKADRELARVHDTQEKIMDQARKTGVFEEEIEQLVQRLWGLRRREEARVRQAEVRRRADDLFAQQEFRRLRRR